MIVYKINTSDKKTCKQKLMMVHIAVALDTREIFKYNKCIKTKQCRKRGVCDVIQTRYPAERLSTVWQAGQMRLRLVVAFLHGTSCRHRGREGRFTLNFSSATRHQEWSIRYSAIPGQEENPLI